MKLKFAPAKSGMALLALMTTLNITPAHATSYYGFQEFGGEFQDAEKSPTNYEDDLLCWAAAASNILAWTGWGSVVSKSEDDIFAYFQDHWTDQGGLMQFGWDWWFDGTNDSQGWSGWSQEDINGAGFFTDLDFSDYYFHTSDDSQTMSAIDSYLHAGYGVSLGLHGGGGHAITAWGYEYDAAGNYLGIYVSDSDDDQYNHNAPDMMAYYDVAYFSGKWYLQNFYGMDNWYIGEVQALDGYGGSYTPDSTPNEPVPEPATIFIFGTGILALATKHRKALKK